MSGETQSSSLSGTIYAKVIEMGVIAYQYDDLTITPYFRYKTIADQATTTASFVRWVKSTGPAAGTPTNETTALTPTEQTTTSVDIAVGRVGLAREITTTAKEDSIVGRSLDVQGLIMDAARLYGEYFDTASADLFSTLTLSVGATGQPLSIATMVAAIGQQRTNKARGPMVISLHDNQLKQLQQAQAATTGTAWSTFYAPNAVGGQFGGYFMGCPIWSSGVNETSTGDRLGAIWVDGQAAPEFSAFGFVVKRMPSSLTETHVLMDSNIWASFARTGCGVVANNFATCIRSINA
jgi:hypothetical protein